jgi:hypothetical protein
MREQDVSGQGGGKHGERVRLALLSGLLFTGRVDGDFL